MTRLVQTQYNRIALFVNNMYNAKNGGVFYSIHGQTGRCHNQSSSPLQSQYYVGSYTMTLGCSFGV